MLGILLSQGKDSNMPLALLYLTFVTCNPTSLTTATKSSTTMSHIHRWCLN